MVSFEIFVKSMPPSLSELKVLPSFCFAFKIPDDVTVTNKDEVPLPVLNRTQFQQSVARYTGLLLGCSEQSELLKEREIYPILGKH